MRLIAVLATALVLVAHTAIVSAAEPAVPVMGFGLERLHWRMTPEEVRRAAPVFDTAGTDFSRPDPDTALLEVSHYAYEGCSFALRLGFVRDELDSIKVRKAFGSRSEITAAERLAFESCAPRIERELLNRYGVASGKTDPPELRWDGPLGGADFMWMQASSANPNIESYRTVLAFYPPDADPIAPTPVLGLDFQRLHWRMPSEELRKVFPVLRPYPSGDETLAKTYSYSGCEFRLRYNFYKGGLNAIWLQNHDLKSQSCVQPIERELAQALGPQSDETLKPGETFRHWTGRILRTSYAHFDHGWLDVEFDSPHSELMVEIDLR